jgi:hypothetical protein
MSSEHHPTIGLLHDIRQMFDSFRFPNVPSLNDGHIVICVQDVIVNMTPMPSRPGATVLRSFLCELHREELTHLIAQTCDQRSVLTNSITLDVEIVTNNPTTSETNDATSISCPVTETDASLPLAFKPSQPDDHRYACYFVLNKLESAERQTAHNCQHVVLPHDSQHQGALSTLMITLTRDTESGDNTIGTTQRPFMIVEANPSSSHSRFSSKVLLHPEMP